MTRVYATFIGCKVSQADSEAALAQLTAAGLEAVADRDDADVCVLMTCGVTAEAERKSRRLARRLAQDGRRVYVAGCAATLRAVQFAHPGVDVVSADDWPGLASRLASGAPDAPAGETADGVGAATPAGDGVAAPVTRAWGARPGRRTRFTLKVQDGCAGTCSYCVVRLVRGRPRSLPLVEAVAAAQQAVAAGCGEVVLSGIDLGAYRDAGTPGTEDGAVAGLADLVGALADLPGLLRLRLSSIEPHHLDERLLAAVAHPHVARHLHVPLQAADDGVLTAMRRRYSFRDYLGAVDRLRSRVPDVMLSTDVIVGFPTEDEAAFTRTLAAVESGLFGRVHVFAYSPRPGTEAADLRPLPSAVVRARGAAVGAAARATQRRAAGEVVGRRAEVLVEERRGGLWRGYSSQYVRYYLTGPTRPGTMAVAVADHVHDDGVRGRVLATAAGAPWDRE